MTYTVKRINHSFKWSEVETGKIDIFNWGGKDQYDPEAEFKLVHDENNIYLKMTAKNDYIKSECKNINDMVCNDSCMEAFIASPATPDIYLNFEFSSNGVMYLGAGKQRANRITADPEIIKKFITILVDEPSVVEGSRGRWGFTAIINKEVFEVLTGKPFASGNGKGSFYKCGERVVSHFVATEVIKTENPDFHRPECFGDIIFE